MTVCVCDNEFKDINCMVFQNTMKCPDSKSFIVIKIFMCSVWYVGFFIKKKSQFLMSLHFSKEIQQIQY
jgi:hypothetical protein